MRYLLSLLIFLTIVTGCKQKVLTGQDLKNKLISTMQGFLDKQSHPGVDFHVKDVTYYTEVAKKLYDCEFQVDMHTETTDTLGVMTATITNDFKKVVRLK